jgi:hypothetical protein
MADLLWAHEFADCRGRNIADTDATIDRGMPRCAGKALLTGSEALSTLSGNRQVHRKGLKCLGSGA